ncbi:MAG TPA: phosphopantetheine-binding protein [Afipia sp.]
MPERSQIEADILQFVQARSPQSQITAATDLLDEGLLDSLLLVDLIFRLEERYGIQLGGDQISPGNFRSVAAIADLVQKQDATS